MADYKDRYMVGTEFENLISNYPGTIKANGIDAGSLKTFSEDTVGDTITVPFPEDKDCFYYSKESRTVLDSIVTTKNTYVDLGSGSTYGGYSVDQVYNCTSDVDTYSNSGTVAKKYSGSTNVTVWDGSKTTSIYVSATGIGYTSIDYEYSEHESGTAVGYAPSSETEPVGEGSWETYDSVELTDAEKAAFGYVEDEVISGYTTTVHTKTVVIYTGNYNVSLKVNGNSKELNTWIKVTKGQTAVLTFNGGSDASDTGFWSIKANEYRYFGNKNIHFLKNNEHVDQPPLANRAVWTKVNIILNGVTYKWGPGISGWYSGITPVSAFSPGLIMQLDNVNATFVKYDADLTASTYSLNKANAADYCAIVSNGEDVTFSGIFVAGDVADYNTQGQYFKGWTVELTPKYLSDAVYISKLLPSSGSTVNIGSTDNKFKEIYANRIYGAVIN